MGDTIHESSGTEEAHSPPPPAHTDSHTEVQSEPSFVPLIYPTIDDWRTTIPRAIIEGMTLEQQHESYQRLIALLTRLSEREMHVGESPIPFPNYAIVPRSGRPVDVARATEDFVDSQDWHHDLRIAESRLAKMEEEGSGSPDEVAAESTKISRLKELLEDGAEHFERQGLKSTVLFKEFIVTKEWKEALEDALSSGLVLESFSSKQEMSEVLKRIEASITERESQLVEEGILPLVQAPQTAKRLAANILTTSTSTAGSGSGDKKGPAPSPGQWIAQAHDGAFRGGPTGENYPATKVLTLATAAVNGDSSPKRNLGSNGEVISSGDDARYTPPCKKRKTE